MERDREILISNRYRIRKKIASGGMADIYLGEDIELNRKVAVKVLSANYAGDRNFVARFRGEAQTLAKLDHPNIVDIYDWGRFNHSYYIVMEYIEGISLKELIEKKGPLDPVIAAGYAIQICDALGAAHDNNLIHRDIKPQNILITPHNNIKVTDFGIAKSLNTDITRTLNIVGTAHYISPEQARGDVLDNRTDIYSLGIVIYEMLTGDLPFRGDTSIDISLKHISEKPVKPRKIINTIPGDLEKIVLMCLMKEPSERYPQIRDLRRDLYNFLEKRPLLMGSRKRETSRPRALREKLKKNTAVLITSILAFIFMLLFIGYSVLYYRPEPEVKSEIYVPPLEKTYIETAEDILSMLGLKMVLAGKRESITIPEDYIIEQSPPVNSIMEENSEVMVIISSGSGVTEITTPHIIGLEVDQAGQLLEEMGLSLGTVSSEYSQIFAQDTIISQSPPYGNQLYMGASVNVTVSSGPEVIIVPNIIGLDFTYASRHLDALGLTVVTRIAPVNGQVTEPGMVVTAEPQPGTRLNKGDIVEIGISVLEPLNQVPSLTGTTMTEATADLQSLGILYEIVYVEPDYSFQKDQVLQQWPDAGRHLPLDSKVILFIGK